MRFYSIVSSLLRRRRDAVGQVSLCARWAHTAERAGQDPSARSYAKFPPSTSTADLLQRVRVGQTKRAMVNRAEYAPPSKLAWMALFSDQPTVSNSGVQKKCKKCFLAAFGGHFVSLCFHLISHPCHIRSTLRLASEMAFRIAAESGAMRNAISFRISPFHFGLCAISFSPSM